ncbi:MAG TPA: serine hydrolase [Candidatus Desulfaltia sp.]|nr:serine hydrolase [Candidatus Desulfaltia sp.]
MKSSLLSRHRDALIMTVVVLMVTGFNLWQHRDDPPLGYTEFTGYGFSFVHPQECTLREAVVYFVMPSYWLGDLQGESQGNAANIVGVVWGASQAGGLRGFSDQIIEEARKQNEVTDVEEGELVELGGKQVYVRGFNLRADSVAVPGLMAGWNSPEGRMFMLYNIKLGGDREWLTDQMAKMLRSLETQPPTKPRRLESYWPTDGWRYAHPSEVGLDADTLDAMVRDIRASGTAVDSALMVKNGYVVLDEYFSEYDADDRHIVYSCTKSVVSTLIGIAIDEGYIEGLDVKLVDIFLDVEYINRHEWKSRITLEDMLMMSAGFDARDSWIYEWENLDDMRSSEDPVLYVMSHPMGFEPGSRFEYTNGVSHLLSCIITEKTGLTAAEFAEEHLFGPLGIGDYEWRADARGNNWGYSSLYLTPHDMAKIGYLFLKEGTWEGGRIVSEEWVEAATREHLQANLKDGYGYQWWVDDDGYYLALGYMGQFIYVFPDQDMVAVFTGSSEQAYDYSVRLPERFLIPAVG